MPGILKFIFKHKLDLVGQVLPPVINTTTGFAALGDKNATAYNEYYEIWTGANDNMDKYYQINRWGPEPEKLWYNLTKADWWTANNGYNGSNACNDLKGRDGQQFHPDVKESDIFYLFATDICRSIFIEYVEDIEVSG